MGIADALYPEDDIDPETINQNIRSYIYRFRRSLEPIFKHQLIEYTANGYRLNPNINVMTDIQKFDRLWEQAQRNIPVSQKTHILKRAIHLYRGTVFETACDDHWLVGIATEYKLKYIGLVNELLALLAKYDDYNGINTLCCQMYSQSQARRTGWHDDLSQAPWPQTLKSTSLLKIGMFGKTITQQL